MQKQPLEMFFKRGVPKNFAKLTGKYMCRSLFFKEFAGYFAICYL